MKNGFLMMHGKCYRINILHKRIFQLLLQSAVRSQSSIIGHVSEWEGLTLTLPCQSQ